MNDLQRSQGKRGLTLFCRLLMILSPFLLLAIVSLAAGHNAFAALPVWSDELDTWRSLFNWNAVGFSTGYSGMYEALPSVGSLGVTGVTPILLYGWFVKLFGLSESTIVIANAVWIALAALVFCWLVKPKGSTALMLTGLLTLYVPISLYCVTSMTELFSYALMLFYLAFLCSYYRKRKPLMLALCVLTMLFACVYRGAYAVLLIPLALVYGDMKLGLKTILAAVVSLALVLLCYYLTSLITAPSVLKFTYHFLRAESLGDMWKMLMGHGKANLMDYLASTGSVMQNAFRLLYCGVAALCLLGSFVRVERASRKARVRFGFETELFCCFGLLFVALVFVCAFFETGDWVDFRLLSPFLWLVLGFLALRRKVVIPLAALAACLVTTVMLLTLPAEGAFVDEYRFEAQPDNEKLTVAAQHIPYDASATNPLTNTVRTDLSGMQVQRELAAGLGLQTGWFSTDTTGKSNWILTDQLKCVVEGYKEVYTEPKISVYKLIKSYEVEP